MHLNFWMTFFKTSDLNKSLAFRKICLLFSGFWFLLLLLLFLYLRVLQCDTRMSLKVNRSFSLKERREM